MDDDFDDDLIADACAMQAGNAEVEGPGLPPDWDEMPESAVHARPEDVSAGGLHRIGALSGLATGIEAAQQVHNSPTTAPSTQHLQTPIACEVC
jgi:hypothetical protein